MEQVASNLLLYRLKDTLFLERKYLLIILPPLSFCYYINLPSFIMATHLNYTAIPHTFLILNKAITSGTGFLVVTLLLIVRLTLLDI